MQPGESIALRLHWLMWVNCRRSRDPQKRMRVALGRWRSCRDRG